MCFRGFFSLCNISNSLINTYLGILSSLIGTPSSTYWHGYLVQSTNIIDFIFCILFSFEFGCMTTSSCFLYNVECLIYWLIDLHIYNQFHCLMFALFVHVLEKKSHATLLLGLKLFDVYIYIYISLILSHHIYVYVYIYLVFCSACFFYTIPRCCHNLKAVTCCVIVFMFTVHTSMHTKRCVFGYEILFLEALWFCSLTISEIDIA